MKKYFQAPWSLKELLTSLLLAGTLIAIAAFIMSFFHMEERFADASYGSLYILGLFLLQWVLIFGSLLMVSRKYKLSWNDFGFRRIGIMQTIGYVISAYLLYIGISFIIGILIFYFDLRIPGYQLQENILPIFGVGPLNMLIAVITIVIVAPFIEEIIFRGLIMRTLVNRIGAWWGSILAALGFAALHVPWQSFIPIFILGLIMNSIVLRSKSLWPSICFHMLNNGITLIIQLLIANGTISLESVT